MVLRTKDGPREDRFHAAILAGLVVVVQLAWGGMLVYLGLHYL